MIKMITVVTLMSLSSTLLAESCWPLYQNKADEIEKKDGYDTYVGGQLFVVHGQLGYDPGIKVPARIDNWARDFVDAIKWGPYSISFSSEDPREEWLKTLYKSINKECPNSSEKEYESLRAMMKELMDDGSLCPQNKIFEPKFLGGKKDFKKVLSEAVKDQRFPQYCNHQAVANDGRESVDKAGRSPSVIERTPLRNRATKQ
ncbi:hypothetical protein [Peredibacter starrii]|uniref:Uncharacterized protein n=1 Tax=Peredibacter starrii TaxID=28202 RepID=A0AAX4HLR2_9BACT|nr:hypothetical protein [Peredibacter starrii]WPU64199.1 hypothetical protein SOO65_16005 [Peredibacter starrii]